MNTKQTNLVYVAIGFVIIAFSLTFFQNPGITGHVSVEAGYQPLNLLITESQAYTVTSDYESAIKLTSMRFSGEVIGDGKAEVILDNGLGQRLLVYTNEVEKAEDNKITGMGKVTGLAVGDGDAQEKGAIDKAAEIKEKALLNLMFAENLAPIKAETKSGAELKSGKFANECKETCLMEMELSKNLTYGLEFRVSEGTQLKLDNMIYGILIE